MSAQTDEGKLSLKLILFFSLFLVALSLYGLMQGKSDLDMLGAILIGILGIYLELFVIAYRYLSEEKL